ncbi:MAG: UDP-N-acetylmuramoyl-tripeptide--D-alanyl-D-alanine ligase [Bacteroidia bacterium]|jgi:UDP-N-acetylmuramoyl-tripeptide--D-alanyl-D-alanine ligase|nr:UDP-N-acetylmuramoyl-tripeptide--D-alanyl-D-alanine ligase [Bacteroidia bacterium]
MPQYTSIQKLYDYFQESDFKICTDTRKLEPGALFVCLKGENFNANQFAATAIESGCRYAIVDEEQYISHPNIKFVDNTLSALQNLANYHRNQFKLPVLAITGSNGKTTNKELIHAVLEKKYKTLATIGNLNNHIGVPLTLLRLRKEHEFLIVEMGANHQGEIAALCSIAEPDYGLITNIGKAHLEGFGGLEGVIKGKSEMYHYIRKKKGKVFVNGDDTLLLSLTHDLERITYGTEPHNTLVGREIQNSETLAFAYKIGQEGKETKNLHTHLIGSYNLPNFLAAACIGHYFSVKEKDICEALKNYTPNMNRSQLVQTKKNKIVLDAYNANPNSMQLAIENFAKLPAERKLVLLGDMFELGAQSREEHLKLIELLQKNKIENAVLVGASFFALETKPYLKFQTTSECKTYLQKASIENYTILIKGSRGMKMEVLLEVL